MKVTQIHALTMRVDNLSDRVLELEKILKASNESLSVRENEAQKELFNLIKNIQTEIRLNKPNLKNIDFWLYRMERIIKFNND